MWEFSNSLWIAWTFTFGLLSWIPFFYVGARAKKPEWALWGLFYLLPFLLVIFGGDRSLLTDIGGFLTFPLGIMAIIHAFNIRPEYLARLQGIEAHQRDTETEWLEEMEAELSGKKRSKKTKKSAAGAADPIGDTVRSMKPSGVVGSGKMIDVNNDPAEVIATLPGFTLFLGQKVVLIRSMSGAFRSFEDFSTALNLPEELAPHIQPLLLFQEVQKAPVVKIGATLSDL